MIIRIDDEFDLEKIVYSGQCFRPKRLSDGKYFFIIGNEYLIISNVKDNLYEISCNEDTWNNVWCDYFDLQTSYRDIRKLIDSNDSFMLKSGNSGFGIRILRQNKWEMLISYIISQRKSISAIRTAVEKLCKLYGHKIAEIDGEEIYSFPSAENMQNATEDELAACGLGYRVAYIKDAIARVLDGRLNLDNEELDDDTLFEYLKTVHGVGDKVSNCICLFAYHRTGRAPVDTWILKVMKEHYEGNNPFLQYGVNAGVMQQYVFYYVQNQKGL